LTCFLLISNKLISSDVVYFILLTYLVFACRFSNSQITITAQGDRLAISK